MSRKRNMENGYFPYHFCPVCKSVEKSFRTWSGCCPKCAVKGSLTGIFCQHFLRVPCITMKVLFPQQVEPLCETCKYKFQCATGDFNEQIYFDLIGLATSYLKSHTAKLGTQVESISPIIDYICDNNFINHSYYRYGIDVNANLKKILGSVV